VDSDQLTTATAADAVAAALHHQIQRGELVPVTGELRHHFSQCTFDPHFQLYARELTMPAGALIVSEIHATLHQFVISKGRVKVMYPSGDVEEYAAPYHGTTTPGTQRILNVIEETVWTTFHIVPAAMTDPDEIKRSIIVERINPLLTEEGQP
jgi:hypothetical protein